MGYSRTRQVICLRLSILTTHKPLTRYSSSSRVQRVKTSQMARAGRLKRVTLSTHNGTHLDAPYHFASTMDGGERAITIDEVPLEWCFQRGVKLNFRHFPDGYVVTPADIDAELNRIDVALEPLDIVLVNTSAGTKYGQDDYVQSGCGVGREATLHLLEQGVRLTGTDAWSWDAPFSYTAQRYAVEGDAGIIWEGHRAGRDIGYCHIEKLHNLEALPATGFQVACFPVKIHAAFGWVDTGRRNFRGGRRMKIAATVVDSEVRVWRSPR